MEDRWLFGQWEVRWAVERSSGRRQRVRITTPVVSEAARDEARRLIPGVDVHGLEAGWRAVWAKSGGPRLRKPDAAFLGWVRKRTG